MILAFSPVGVLKVELALKITQLSAANIEQMPVDGLDLAAEELLNDTGRRLRRDGGELDLDADMASAIFVIKPLSFRRRPEGVRRRCILVRNGCSPSTGARRSGS